MVEDTEKSDDKLQTIAPDIADVANGTESPQTEYEEYLDLNREFSGKRLQKLMRKVEYALLFLYKFFSIPGSLTSMFKLARFTTAHHNLPAVVYRSQ